MPNPPGKISQQLVLPGFGDPPPPEWRRALPGFPRHALFLAFRLSQANTEQFLEETTPVRRRFGLFNPPIPPERLHMTVFPIGAGDEPPPPTLVERVSQAMDSLATTPLAIPLDRIQSFRNRRSQWPLVAAARQRHAAMIALQSGIRNALRARGLDPPRYEGSSPHVTSTWDRDIPEPIDIPPITLRADRILLIHSHVGKARHDALESWRLGR